MALEFPINGTLNKKVRIGRLSCCKMGCHAADFYAVHEFLLFDAHHIHDILQATILTP